MYKALLCYNGGGDKYEKDFVNSFTYDRFNWL